jgi:hypothetical protein
MVLQALEMARRTHFDDPITFTDEATVEHILPASWSSGWPLPDGTVAETQNVNFAAMKGLPAEVINAIQLRESLKNTLGNLTLVTQPLNSKLGNNSFAAKKEQLRKSALVLNRDVVERDHWDEEAIRERGASLADTAAKLWPMPAVVAVSQAAE